METRLLPAHVAPRRWSLNFVFAQALIFSAIGAGTAAAQPYGSVQVTRDRTEIECFGRSTKVCMTAPEGTVLEVLFVDGDRYNHQTSNWYWVLLPPDQWGRRVSGWIAGNAVAHVPMPRPSSAASTSPGGNLNDAPRVADTRNDSRDTTSSAVVEEVEGAARRAVISDVVVNFDFDQSSLTDEARRQLEGAIAWTTSPAPGKGLTVALAGHADAIGRDGYNDQLGSSRAETVKRYLMEQLGIPADSITVVSYGEKQPVAPNKTRAGRALNRRVEIKGSGS